MAQRGHAPNVKTLRVRQTLFFEERTGYELCKIQERMLRIKDSMEIEDANGQQIGMVKKTLITLLRERWTINLRNGPDLEIQGNILDHEYRIERERDRVAEVSKKWSGCATRTAWRSTQGRTTS